MKLMFTGTQIGMTRHQKNVLYDWLVQRDAIIEEVRHGGCVGADAQFHAECVAFGLAELIEVYPSNIPSKQARLDEDTYKIMHNPAEPLDRNLTMVYASEVCLATPKERDEIMRSGTWATIRAARRNHLRVIIIEPDGAVVED